MDLKYILNDFNFKKLIFKFFKIQNVKDYNLEYIKLKNNYTNDKNFYKQIKNYYYGSN